MKKILFSAIASLAITVSAAPATAEVTNVLTVSERLCPPERSPCSFAYIYARLIIAPARGRDHVTEDDLELARTLIPAEQRNKYYQTGDRIVLRG